MLSKRDVILEQLVIFTVQKMALKMSKWLIYGCLWKIAEISIMGNI